MVITLILALVLVAVFFAGDAFLRPAGTARSLAPRESDRGSTRRLVQAFLVCIVILLVSPFLNSFSLGSLTGAGWVGWMGLFLMVLGLGLRAWSTRVLGSAYTRTLQTQGEQRLVESGPYRWVRHPGYTGTLLVWIGAGVAAQNSIATAAITLVVTTAYVHRIRIEEAMLAEKFGQAYRDYTRRTRRLLPFLY